MYVKVSARKTRDGASVRYLQLAHNEWDPEARVSRTKVLHNFGREDDLDRAAVTRLVASLSRLLAPGEALGAAADPELAFTASVPMGGAYALDGIWRSLGLDTLLRRLGGKRRHGDRFERILFALVANRALAPSSKLAAAEWITHDVHVEGLPEVGEDACYRAMDWLLEVEAELAKEVYFATAHLLNLEVDLLFFYHRREDRIRAHIVLCWLALLLIRIAENHTKRRWPAIARELDRLHLGVFTGPAGTFARRTDLTTAHTALLGALGLTPPPLIAQATPAST